MEKHVFIGKHIVSEMYDISDKLILDNELILNILVRGVKLSGAKCEGVLCKRFLPSGFSAVLLLSESHASVHTYPEQGALFADAFTCGTNCNPQIIIDEWVSGLSVKDYKTNIIHRGGRQDRNEAL